MRYTTLSVLAGLIILTFTSGANAADPKANRGPLRAPITMKAMGAADVIEGPVAFGTALYSQLLAYAMPGTLKSDVTADGGTVVLKAGTPVYGGSPDKADASTVWCTRKADIKPMCIAPGAGKNAGSSYAFQVGDNAAVEGWQPQGVLTKVNTPDVDLDAAPAPAGYRITFALNASQTMEVERVIWRDSVKVVTRQSKLASRHDIVFSSRDGEALYVTYDPASDSFSAKRYATEAEAMAQ